MRRPGQQFTLPVYLVAAQARNRRLAGQFGTQQPPRTFGIQRSHQVPNAALEMHAVAAQAIVHQQALPVVPCIQEQALVSRAVRPAPPLGELLAVARPAPLHQPRNIALAQANRVGKTLPHMLHQAPQIPQMETRVQRRDLAVAGAARHVPVARCVPRIVIPANLVAARAGSAGVVLVIQAARRKRQHQDRGGRQHRPAPHPARHTPRPFQPFTMRSDAWYAIAMIVSTGLKPPLVTCTLPSITYRLS